MLVDETTETVFGCPLPLTLATTPRHRITNHGDEENHDVSASYLTALFSLTIYVYNRKMKSIPNDVSSEVIVDEWKLATQAVMGVEAAKGVRLVCKEAFPASLNGGETPDVLVARLGLQGDADRYKTFVHMMTKNNHFIKVRTTLQETSFSGAGMTDAFVKKYADLLRE